MAISRDNIFAAQDIKSEIVPVPEWGGSLTVITMSGTERDAFETAHAKVQTSTENIRARLLVRCLVDDDGRRVFTDDDAEALGKKSANVLDRLFTVARKLNGMSNSDVDELAKNS